VSFTIKPDAVPCLSISRRRQSSLSTVFIFVSLEEKGYYHVVSVVQLSLTAALTASIAFVLGKKIIFSQFISIF